MRAAWSSRYFYCLQDKWVTKDNIGTPPTSVSVVIRVGLRFWGDRFCRGAERFIVRSRAAKANRLRRPIVRGPACRCPDSTTTACPPAPTTTTAAAPATTTSKRPKAPARPPPRRTVSDESYPTSDLRHLSRHRPPSNRLRYQITKCKYLNYIIVTVVFVHKKKRPPLLPTVQHFALPHGGQWTHIYTST